MKLLAFLFAFTCGQVIAQVPVLLKSKNIDTFEVIIYNIEYHISNDSIKIDDYKYVDLNTYYVGDLSYYTVLPKNSWFLVIYLEPEGSTKSLFFETSELSYKEPIVFVADFNTTKDYYVQYDPEKNIYSGSEIDIPRN
jgi:hypothetical protein